MTSTQSPQQPDRNLALELVRVTESAALSASRWVGRGDKNGADGAAVDAMRTVLSTVPMDGIVVIGEGEKDEAPMLFNGEQRRRRHRAADRRRRRPDRRHHADRLRPGQRHRRHRRQRAGHDVRSRARASTCTRSPSAPRPPARSTSPPRPRRTCAGSPRPRASRVRDLTVVILDRDRAHRALIAEVRASGARVKLITDGDIFGAIATGWPDAGVDVLLGIGGTPEGVTAAAALKCMGGEIQGLLCAAQRRPSGRRPSTLGYDLDRGAHHRRPGQGQQLLLRGDRHHRRRAAARRALRARRGAHPEPGDAVARVARCG